MRHSKTSLVLLGIHSAIVILAAFVDPHWDDMNPSIVLLMALYGLDYPIHFLLGMPEVTGGYLFLLLFLGGALWYAIGFVLSAILGALREMITPSNQQTPSIPTGHAKRSQNT